MENRVVLITGGSRGIGKAMARHFAALGDHVVIGGVSVDGARQTVAEIEADGGRATALAVDVRDEAQVAEFVKRGLALTGRIDVLVNNAGVAGPVKLIEDVTLEEWQATLAINLTGAFLCCKHVLPIMKEQGQGAVVNIASVVGKKTLPLRAVYAASKMAIIGFTRALAADYGPFGVRVNSVCPGAVAGERQDQALRNAMLATGRTIEDVTREKLEETPLRRFIEPKQIAGVVAFLCSEAAGAMTGQDINVSGGRVMY